MERIAIMNRDARGNIIRPFTNARKQSVLEFRDSGLFRGNGAIGRPNWRMDLHRFFRDVKGDREVTAANCTDWIQPHYAEIDRNDWGFCLPDIREDFNLNFDENEIPERNQLDVSRARRRAMFGIRPTVWGIVAGNIADPIDFGNAILANLQIPALSNIFRASRAEVLFHFVFPLLMNREELGRADLFNCRLVCRRWSAGVDNFLETNTVYRPGFEDRRLASYLGVSRDNTDIDDSLLTQFLVDQRILFGFSDDVTKQMFMSEARGHPVGRSPFVGRHFQLHDIGYNVPQDPTNERFLQEFGHHLHFLTIALRNYTPEVTIDRILALVTLTPNLKGLSLNLLTNVLEDDENVREYINTVVTDHVRVNLPQLESLFVHNPGMPLPDIHDAIVSIFPAAPMRHVSTILGPSAGLLMNLVDVTFVLAPWKSILPILRMNSPIRRMALNIALSMYSYVLFRIIYQFRDTLRNISLTVTEDEPIHTDGYYNQRSLTGLNRVITFTMEGTMPPSFNFICGLADTLMYLNFQLNEESDWNPEELPNQQPHEVMDLRVRLMRAVVTDEELNLYRSNVWIVLPKLREICVVIQKEQKHKYNFDRGFYDFLHRRNNNGA